MDYGIKRAARMLALLAVASALASAKTGRHPFWTIDLEQLPHTRVQVTNGKFYRDEYVAATQEDLGIALEGGNPSSALGPWETSLLVYDAPSGSLRKTCGPWKDQMVQGFWATDRGDFLLASGAPAGKMGSAVDLQLFSPECRALGQVHLPALPDPDHDRWTLMLSSSRRTLLTVARDLKESHFTIRDADTFAVRAEWREPVPEGTSIASVSDQGILALKYLKPGGAFDSPAKIIYRAFNHRSWRELADQLTVENRYPFAVLLSDSIFLEGAQIGRMGICHPTSARIEVRQLGGQLLATKSFSKEAHAVGFPLVGSVATDTIGGFFGTMLRSINVGWLACNSDMESERDDIIVWSDASLERAKRIKFEEMTSPPLPLAISPDGSWFAVSNGRTLMVRPLRASARLK